MRARVRRLPILVASTLLLVFLADLSRAPERQLSVKAAVAGIHAYQRVGSPLLARVGVRCRFQPTCSHYAETSLQRYGLLRGGWRSARRVLRCGPWTSEGTVDRP